jgi:hypothetical protein
MPLEMPCLPSRSILPAGAASLSCSGLRESVSNLTVDVFLIIEEGSGKALARRYATVHLK